MPEQGLFEKIKKHQEASLRTGETKAEAAAGTRRQTLTARILLLRPSPGYRAQVLAFGAVTRKGKVRHTLLMQVKGHLRAHLGGGQDL